MSIRAFKGIEPQIAESAYIDQDSTVIGDVHLGEHSSVWPAVVIRGDVNHIRIGSETNVQDGSVLHVTAPNEHAPQGFPLLIGDRVTIGHGVILHACTIEDECLIGMGATVLDGAIVRKNVLLAAGSLVPPGKELESGYLWVGSPVKRARPLSEAEMRFFVKSSINYRELAVHYKNPTADK